MAKGRRDTHQTVERGCQKNEDNVCKGGLARPLPEAGGEMTALALTIFVSLGLAVFFVGLFILQASEGAGNPRDALLPLEHDATVPDAELRRQARDIV